MSKTYRRLTWGEFKRIVDATEGVTDDSPLSLVEVHTAALFIASDGSGEGVLVDVESGTGEVAIF